MLRQQLSEQKQHKDENLDRSETVHLKAPHPNGTYGSLSSTVTGAFDNQHRDKEDDDDELIISGSEEEDDDDNDEDDEDDESELSYDDSSDEEQDPYNKSREENKRKIECKAMEPILKPFLKLYRLVRDAIILITNTDDVWDSPAFDRQNFGRRGRSESIHSFSSTSGSIPYQRQRRMATDPTDSLLTEQRVTFQHKLGVLFWFLVLAICYALERCSFKYMADRTGPFRMVIGGEFVVVLHAIITGTWMGLRWLCKKSKTSSAMLPYPNIGVMAILDTLQLLLVIISASHVAPTLTAILVHVTIPLTTLINHMTRPSGICGRGDKQPRPLVDEEEEYNDDHAENNHNLTPSPPTDDDEISPEIDDPQRSQLWFGSTLIMLSSILALSPAILTLVAPALFSMSDVMADRTAWNTILFFASHIPGAFSQYYKEKTLAAYASPVDPDVLNMILSVFTAIFAFLISPILYPLQGLADMPSTPDSRDTLRVQGWIHQYPSTEVSKNFSQGLKCFIGVLSDDVQIREYPEEAHCDFAYGLVLLHVFSIIVISHAVEKICNAGAFKIMHKGLSAGIILSVVLLFFYQVFVDDVEYGVIPTFWHITCAAVLVMGSEVYHRVTLETPSFETEYPEPGPLYDEDE